MKDDSLDGLLSSSGVVGNEEPPNEAAVQALKAETLALRRSSSPTDQRPNTLRSVSSCLSLVTLSLLALALLGAVLLVLTRQLNADSNCPSQPPLVVEVEVIREVEVVKEVVKEVRVKEQLPVEKLVERWQLCPRASAAQELELHIDSVNHFLLPHGTFSFPSANISTDFLRSRGYTNHAPPFPTASYLELYVQEALFVQELNELKLAVILLPEGGLGPLAGHHHAAWEYQDLLNVIAVDLQLTSNADNHTHLWSVSHIELDSAIYWVSFTYQRSSLDDAPPEHLLVHVTHPGMVSSSSSSSSNPACSATSASTPGSSSSSPSSSPSPSPSPCTTSDRFSLSVCRTLHRRVQYAFCSNALHTDGYIRTIRAFVTYHAYLGIHRFVLFDRGMGYDKALQPLIDSGLVEYYYFPYPNRNMTSTPWKLDNWSQLGLIAICVKQQEHVSDYVALFDPDEWIVIPRKVLPETELQRGVVDSFFDFSVLDQPPFPSSCIAFRPRAGELEPDVLLDTSQYPLAIHPLLRCQSMLSSVLSQLSVSHARTHHEERLALALKAGNASLRLDELRDARDKLAYLFTESRDATWATSLLRTIQLLRYEFPESIEGAKARQEQEAAHPQTLSADAERFSNRFKNYMNPQWSKAFYATSPQLRGLQMHPYAGYPEVHVDPNILRMNHYANDLAPRSILTEDQINIQTIADTEAMSVLIALRLLNRPTD